MTTYDAVRLVAAREIRVKLRDKAFIWSTIIFLAIAAAATVLPSLFDGGSTSVAVAPGTSATALADAGLKVRTVDDDAEAERLVRAGDVDAAVVAGPRVLAMDEEPSEVVDALSARPAVELLDPNAMDPVLAFLVPYAFAFVFFVTSLTFGLQIAQSVTEEKQTRIVEILVAAVPVRALLAGKVVGGAVLAFGQIALIAVVAYAGTAAADAPGNLLALLGPAIGWFLPFFVVGFVMLAALWAAVGALVSRQEDIGGASTPVQMIVMLPFFAVVFLQDNPTAMTLLSYLPVSSPTAMPVRLFTGDAAGWEPFLSLAALAVTAVAMVFVGARIYEGSLLRTSGRTRFVTAWRDREAARLTD
ncbi:ABC transporter permease [Micromonospora sagamiensis]|uniref:ABC-2 type transport system permease protein n=1 Tax=Micromonospora sagamiensis TaxID=47875 RepID=A0A562WJ31_9ACTN|nr:ABC transporter permease [Micromonospora sagamiensis]TWJ29544.1 ABC-2 type transport system permease protein [Micromonospora sagamiensis]BCL17427.1 ABC transporter permease [Micromonospora sagamiensis]